MSKFLLAALLALPLLAPAQVVRDATDYVNDRKTAADSPDARSRRGKELLLAPAAYLVFEEQPGVLILPNNQRVRQKSLRLNVALQLVEARDTLGTVRLLPPGSVRGFEMGTGVQLRRFSSRMVRAEGTKREFVEEFSDRSSPLLLATRHTYIHQDAEFDPILRIEKRPARDGISDQIIAGPETMPETPLRPLALNEKQVLRLFGARAEAMRAYARQQNLSFEKLGDVMKLVDYYNQTAGK